MRTSMASQALALAISADIRMRGSPLSELVVRDSGAALEAALEVRDSDGDESSEKETRRLPARWGGRCSERERGKRERER